MLLLSLILTGIVRFLFVFHFRFVFFRIDWCQSEKELSSWLSAHAVIFNAVLIEPHHAKKCLRGFSTRSVSNQPAQLQKLAKFVNHWI